jgi:hypothetical protein
MFRHDVLKDIMYDNIWETKLHYESGVFHMRTKVENTAHGDGNYRGNDGSFYRVSMVQLE